MYRILPATMLLVTLTAPAVGQELGPPGPVGVGGFAPPSPSVRRATELGALPAGERNSSGGASEGQPAHEDREHRRDRKVGAAEDEALQQALERLLVPLQYRPLRSDRASAGDIGLGWMEMRRPQCRVNPAG